MTLARLTTDRGTTYEVVQFTDGAEWVLRDEHNGCTDLRGVERP
jgi:hypothetical protein